MYLVGQNLQGVSAGKISGEFINLEIMHADYCTFAPKNTLIFNTIEEIFEFIEKEVNNVCQQLNK